MEVFGFLLRLLDDDLAMQDATEARARAELLGLNVASELWNSLKRKFEGTNLSSNKMAMLTEWEALQQKPGEAVDSWFSRIRAAASRLALVGEPQSESVKVLKALKGMSPGYDVETRLVRTAVPAATLDSAEVSMMQREKDLPSEAAEAGAASAGVHGFSFVPGFRGGGAPQQSPPSWGRGAGGRSGRGGGGGRGGSRELCRNFQAGKCTRGASCNYKHEGGGSTGAGRPQAGGATPSGIQCHTCHGFGHKAADCANNKKGLLAGGGGASLFSSDEFFLDSCAGVHGTPRKEILRDFVPADQLSSSELSGIGMTTASGQLLRPSGKGRMDLVLDTGHPIQFQVVYFFPKLKYNLISLGVLVKEERLTFRGDEAGQTFYRGKSKILHAKWQGDVLRTRAEALPGDLREWDMGADQPSAPPSEDVFGLAAVQPVAAEAEAQPAAAAEAQIDRRRKSARRAAGCKTASGFCTPR